MPENENQPRPAAGVTGAAVALAVLFAAFSFGIVAGVLLQWGLGCGA